LEPQQARENHARLVSKATTRVLTPDELAARWSVPKSHVYRLTREGRIPVVKLGRYYRYRLDEIERFELGEDVESKATK
jgi:excisionase family DNA binding protein